MNCGIPALYLSAPLDHPQTLSIGIPYDRLRYGEGGGADACGGRSLFRNRKLDATNVCLPVGGVAIPTHPPLKMLLMVVTENDFLVLIPDGVYRSI